MLMKPIRLVILIINFSLLEYNTSCAQFSIEWSKIYSDSGYTNSIFETMVDSTGNVIIACNRFNLQNNDADPMVIKFNPTGNV